MELFKGGWIRRKFNEPSAVYEPHCALFVCPPVGNKRPKTCFNVFTELAFKPDQTKVAMSVICLYVGLWPTVKRKEIFFTCVCWRLLVKDHVPKAFLKIVETWSTKSSNVRLSVCTSVCHPTIKEKKKTFYLCLLETSGQGACSESFNFFFGNPVNLFV